LPDVPYIEIAKFRIYEGAHGEGCPFPATQWQGVSARHRHIRTGRGVTYSSSSLIRCLAIPDIQGRGAKKPHVFGVYNSQPFAAWVRQAAARNNKPMKIMDDDLDKGPDGEPLEFIEDIVDWLSDMMFPNADPDDGDYGD